MANNPPNLSSSAANYQIPVLSSVVRRDFVVSVLEQTVKGKLVYLPLSKYMQVKDFVDLVQKEFKTTKNATDNMLNNSNFRYLARHLAQHPTVVLVFDNCHNLDKPVALKLAKLVSSVHNSCVLIKC